MQLAQDLRAVQERCKCFEGQHPKISGTAEGGERTPVLEILAFTTLALVCHVINISTVFLFDKTS
jgi:hypothetical protein